MMGAVAELHRLQCRAEAIKLRLVVREVDCHRQAGRQDQDHCKRWCRHRS